MTRDELEKQIDANEPIRKLSLAGIDLSHGALLGGMFEEVDFTGVDLRGASLEHASLV